MKRVLIVEDEKMIRQGIKTMVLRSGVPVEEVLECSNGLMALDILKEQQVDVMFTDIRTPKMDGIQLVGEIKKLKYNLEIVAISGYDDFNYAVEMLRNGVREYILKPVERQKIAEILSKIETELSAKNAKSLTERQIGLAQIKHLLTDSVTVEELELLAEKYESMFFPEGYHIIATGKGVKLNMSQGLMAVTDVKHCNLYVVTPQVLKELEEEMLSDVYCGISNMFTGIRQLKAAYEEAFDARKRGYYQMKTCARFDDRISPVPDKLIEQEKDKMELNAWSARLNLVGTDSNEKLVSFWNGLFQALKLRHIDIPSYEESMADYFDEFKKQYGNVLTQVDLERMYLLENMYAYANVDDYQNSLMEFILEIQSRINDTSQDSKNLQKIKKAVAYIEENYDKDLNMAVVSNEISMNYSLFSFAFKQYTGTNFVTYLRDIRMEKAKQLLTETDFKVIDISQQVGYDNEKHFMKVFKSVCGVSPTEYRKVRKNI